MFFCLFKTSFIKWFSKNIEWQKKLPPPERNGEGSQKGDQQYFKEVR